MYKKYYVIFIVITTIMGLMLACKSKEPDRYYNNENAFSIVFPKEWNKDEGYKGTIIRAVSPIKSFNDIIPASVSVIIDPLKQDMTIEKYIELGFVLLKKGLSNIKEYESGKLLIHDKKALWFIYSYDIGKIQVKALVYTILKDKKAYVITCLSEKNRFEEYKNEFNKIAQSFKFE